MNKKKHAIYTHMLAFLVIFVLLGGVFAWGNHAQALEYDGGGRATPIDCNLSDQSLVVKVVYCVKMSVFDSTEVFLEQTSELMLPVVHSAMVLAMVFMGVRLVGGEPNPQTMVFKFLLRFGIVYLLVDNFGGAMGGLTNDIFMIMEQLQGFSINALYNSSTPLCDISSTPAAPTNGAIIPITYTPWEYLDCVFDYIFGFGVDATIASSIFGLLGSVLVSGTVGTMTFFIGAAAVLSLAFFAFRVVYIVLISYIYVGFLIVLVPLMAPLLMFTVTENHFQKWWTNLLAGLVQPFIMVAYLAFALPLLDHFVFAEDGRSLQETLGEQEEIMEKYRLAAPLAEVSAPTNFDFFEDVTTGRITPNIFNPMQSGELDWFAFSNFTKVDFGEQHIQELLEVAMSLLRILGVTYLITKIAGVIPQMVSFMFMAGFPLQRTFSSPMPFEPQVRQGFNSFSKAVKNAGENAGNNPSGMFGRGERDSTVGNR